jgi:hypothetical protein
VLLTLSRSDLRGGGSTQVDPSANTHQIAIGAARDLLYLIPRQSVRACPLLTGAPAHANQKGIHKALRVVLSKLADKHRRGFVMESSNEPRRQLLSLSKDPAHMVRITAMLHAHGIQTRTELTSLPWRSAGFESFVMVSTEDYTKASALCINREIAIAFTGPSPLVTTEVDEAWQHGVRR